MLNKIVDYLSCFFFIFIFLIIYFFLLFLAF